VKVLTYNIHQWEGQDGRLDIERLAEVIDASQASVVSLNEVLHPLYTNYSVQEPLVQLAELLGMHWAFGESYRLARRPAWWGPIGNAVLSRHPIEAASNQQLPRLPMTQGRNLLAARVKLGVDRHFSIYSTHLDHAFEGTRLWQLRGVLEELRSSGDGPHLLLGDFNTHTPVGSNGQWLAPPVIRWLRSNGYVDAYSAAGKGAAMTFRYVLPWFRIDYIFVPQAMRQRLVSCRTLSSDLIDVASDHRPVLAELDCYLGCR